MRFNTAQECITPCWPVKLGGYANRTKCHEGVLMDLFVKSLLIDDGNNRVLIVSLDLCMIDRVFVDDIKIWANKKYGFSPKDILVHTIHTHSGPLTFMSRQVPEYKREETEEYMKFLKERIFACIDNCMTNPLQDGFMEVGTGETWIAVNRRECKGEKVVLGANLSGMVDRNLFIVRITNKDNEVKVILYSCSCHPVAMKGDLLYISPDYPGAATNEIEKFFPGSMAIFLQGACGNLNIAISTRTKANSGNEVATSAQSVIFAGRILANDVKNVLKHGMKRIEVSLETKLDNIFLPLGEYKKDDLTELSESSQQFFSEYASWMLDRLGNGTAPKTCEFLLGVLKFNDSVRLLLAEGEMMTETAQAMRERYGSGITMLMGYSNGYVGYIPTEEMLHEGGYEVESLWKKFGYPAPLADNAEKMLVNYFD